MGLLDRFKKSKPDVREMYYGDSDDGDDPAGTGGAKTDGLADVGSPHDGIADSGGKIETDPVAKPDSKDIPEQKDSVPASDDVDTSDESTPVDGEGTVAGAGDSNGHNDKSGTGKDDSADDISGAAAPGLDLEKTSNSAGDNASDMIDGNDDGGAVKPDTAGASPGPDDAPDVDSTRDGNLVQDTLLSEKGRELDDIEKRIQDVKAEYGESVKNLMDTKKDLHQKRLDLERVQEQLESLQKNVDAKAQIDSETAKEIAAKKGELEKISGEITQAQETYNELLEQISKEQHALSVIKTQQSETEQMLEEANARLYNAKEELNTQEHFQDPDSLTSAERAFIEGGAATGGDTADKQQAPLHPSTPSSDSSVATDQSRAGPAMDDAQGRARHASVVEAASVVVASLKSKLNMTRKELEAVQLMLEQERAQHEDTKRLLDSALRGETPAK